ncbi:MAG: hypothetical protein PHN75_20610 [Syntrophales bacterium]|nr:hypothetical protein [Syntrophales bacterium]
MSKPMPAIFVGHGNPMNALSRNAYTEGWAAIGASVPRPLAVLSVKMNRSLFPSTESMAVRSRCLRCKSAEASKREGKNGKEKNRRSCREPSQGTIEP